MKDCYSQAKGLLVALCMSATSALWAVTLEKSVVSYDITGVAKGASVTLSGTTTAGAVVQLYTSTTSLFESSTPLGEATANTEGLYTYLWTKGTLDVSTAAYVRASSDSGVTFSPTLSINFPAMGNAFYLPSAADPTTSLYKKALVISWDGCRGDVAADATLTPNLHALAAIGSGSYKGFAGGFKYDKASHCSTVTGPGINAMLTGVWSLKNNIHFNGDTDPNYATYPTFFSRLKDKSNNTMQTVALIGWEDTWTNWLSKIDPSAFDIHYVANDIEKTAYHTNAVNILSSNASVDLLFYATAQPDNVGHTSGFSASNPAYTAEIKALDAQLGALVAAVKSRATINQEEWLIIVTADHGGGGDNGNTSHGSQSKEDRQIPFIVAPIKADGTANPALVPVFNYVGQGAPHTAVAPTLLKHFGYTDSEVAGMGLDSGSFGLPVPQGQAPLYFDAEVNDATQNLEIGWLPPTPYALGVPWTITVSINGAAATTLTADQVNAGIATFEVPYLTAFTINIIASTTDDNGAAVSLPKTITATWDNFPELDVTTTTLFNDLHSYLPMEGSIADASGNNAIVTPKDGTAKYVVGPAGQAADFDNTWYLDLGKPNSMVNGSFTFALWVYSTKEYTDTAIFGTQDWTSGDNQGFSLNNYSWNNSTITWAPGGGVDRLSVTASRFNQWDHIVVSFDRTNNLVTAYRNGNLTEQKPFMSEENINISMCPGNFTIGNSGGYGYRTISQQDEVALWNRALSEVEASSLYTTYNGQLPIQAIAISQATITEAGNLSMTISNQNVVQDATYGICYGFTDGGKDTLAWDHTEEITFGGDGVVTFVASQAIVANRIVYYRLYQESTRGRIYSDMKYVLPEGLSLSTGLTHYYPMNRTANNAFTASPTSSVKGEQDWVAEAKTTSPSGSTSGVFYNNSNTNNDRTWSMNLGQPQALQSGNATIGMWLYVSSECLNERAFFGSHDGAVSTSSQGVTLLKNSLGLPTLSYTTGATIHSLNAGYIEDQWVYVTYVFNREANTVTTYANGQQVDQGVFGDITANLAPNGFALGSDLKVAFPGRHMQDEFALWNRALSQAEVIELYSIYNGSIYPSIETPSITAEGATLAFTATVKNIAALKDQTFTYGICYGEVDAGTTLAEWTFTHEVGTLGKYTSNVSWTSTLPLKADVAYRWYITNGAGVTIFTESKRTHLRDGLIMHLPFEGDSNNFIDSDITTSYIKGNTGVTQYAEGKFGQAGHFNKAWVLSAGQPWSVDYDSFTVGLWHMYPSTETGRELTFIGTQNWSSGGNKGFSLNEGYLTWAIAGREDYGAYDGRDKWCYFVFTFDREANVTHVYRDGTLLGSNAFGINRFLWREAFIAGGHNLLIGCSGLLDEGMLGNHYQDEVSLWDRALTPSEVNLLTHTYQGVLTEAIDIQPPTCVTPATTWQLNGRALRPNPTLSYGVTWGATDPGTDPVAWVNVSDLRPLDTQDCTWDSQVSTYDKIVYRWFTKDAGGNYDVFRPYTQTVSTSDLLKDLHVYLPMEGNLLNHAATQEVATPYGDLAKYVVGPAGQAANLDDTWYIHLGKINSVKSGSFTLGMWLKAMDNEVVSDNKFLGTLNWALIGNEGGRGFCLGEQWGTGAPILEWDAIGGGQGRTSISSAYLKNQWCYLTYIFDREADLVTIYINGEYISSHPFHKGTPNADFQPNDQLLFGQIPGGSLSDAKSQMDEIALWNRTITPEEVKVLYSNFNGRIPMNPVTVDTLKQDLILYLDGENNLVNRVTAKDTPNALTITPASTVAGTINLEGRFITPTDATFPGKTAYDLDSTWWINAGAPQCMIDGSFTFALWVKAYDGYTGYQNDSAFFGTQNWWSGNNIGFCLANIVGWTHAAGPGGTRVDYAAHTRNQWQHLAVVFDRVNNFVRFYKNGQRVNQTIFLNEATLGTTMVDSANGLQFSMGTSGGLEHASAPALRARSYQDEIAVWSRTLTEHEITTLYNDHKGILSFGEQPPIEVTTTDNVVLLPHVNYYIAKALYDQGVTTPVAISSIDALTSYAFSIPPTIPPSTFSTDPVPPTATVDVSFKISELMIVGDDLTTVRAKVKVVDNIGNVVPALNVGAYIELHSSPTIDGTYLSIPNATIHTLEGATGIGTFPDVGINIINPFLKARTIVKKSIVE